jgi:hypothetical protein
MVPLAIRKIARSCDGCYPPAHDILMGQAIGLTRHALCAAFNSYTHPHD